MIHCIIQINQTDVGTGRDLSLRNQSLKSLPEIIGAFKTTSSKLIHQSGQPLFQWQKSFYDRIIRTQQELENVRRYIRNNPKNFQPKK